MTITAITPDTPEGLEFFRGVLMRHYDPEWGPKPMEREAWVWACPRR